MSPFDPPRPLAPSEELPEGAEVPPAGVRTMAVVRWALVAAMAALAMATWVGFAAGAPHGAVAAAGYQCPMHPAVAQDAPGQCAICGMDLVAVSAKSRHVEGDAQPDHGEVGHAHASAGHGGAVGAGTAAAPGKYWCPMHPEVTSDDPEARCPKCGGMKLVPRPPAAAVGAGEGHGVPGLVPVVIDTERIQRIGVRTAVAERRPLGADLRTIGVVSVDEARVATVSSRVTGWIEELHAREGGQRVRKGQALATVYSPELLSAQQASVASPLWNPAQAAANPTAAGAFGIDPHRRLQLLGMAPEDVAELHRTGQIRYAQPIRAPIDGYVSRRSAYAGQYVQPGAELFQLVDLSTVWVIADVYEADLSRVRVGQPAQIALEGLPGQRFTGVVEYLYPALASEARTLQARIALRNPDLKLRPGMTAQVVLEAAPRDALSVPGEAVVDTGERSFVFVAGEGGRFEPRRVQVGERVDERVEILDGLAQGERVVTTAAFLVDSESRLRAAVESFTSRAVH